MAIGILVIGVAIGLEEQVNYFSPLIVLSRVEEGSLKDIVILVDGQLFFQEEIHQFYFLPSHCVVQDCLLVAVPSVQLPSFILEFAYQP